MTRISDKYKVIIQNTKGDYPQKGEKKKLPIYKIIIAIGALAALYLACERIYYNRVIFGYNNIAAIYGHYPLTSDEGLSVFLIGTATNRGNKPLNPRRFEAKIKVIDEWVSLIRTEIPESIHFEGEENDIYVKNAEGKSLQDLDRAITIDNPADGYLMFVSRELDEESLKKEGGNIFKLECIDEFNEIYKVIFSTTHDKVDIPSSIFKKEVIIEPKKKL